MSSFIIVTINTIYSDSFYAMTIFVLWCDVLSYGVTNIKQQKNILISKYVFKKESSLALGEFQ